MEGRQGGKPEGVHKCERNEGREWRRKWGWQERRKPGVIDGDSLPPFGSLAQGGGW